MVRPRSEQAGRAGHKCNECAGLSPPGARLEARGDTVGSVPPGWGPISPSPPELPRRQRVVVELGRRVLGTGMGGAELCQDTCWEGHWVSACLQPAPWA